MKNLYILPFDHRQSFLELIKASSPPTPQEIAKARAYKKIIYEAFLKALSAGLKKEEAGILVDPWLGQEILLDAGAKGITLCLPLEKSGQKELQLENYPQLIKKFKPAYAKVLIHYNPESDSALNQRQSGKLLTIQKYLKKKKVGFILELVVPATLRQLKKIGGRGKYDVELRPSLMVKALKELQQKGLRPAIWKLEGLETKEQMQEVVCQILPPSRIIILGREEKKKKVEHWLKVGASFEKVMGLAVGRTVFEGPLKDYQRGKIGRERAITKIAQNYVHFIEVFKKARLGK